LDFFNLNFGKLGRKDEEEGLGSSWLTLRKREDTVRWKKKHYITFSGHLALEEAMGW